MIRAGPALAVALAASLVACGDDANPGFAPALRLGLPGGDDWEPALAASPGGDVYVLYKHRDAGGVLCAGCDQHIVVQRSTDGGRSFGPPAALAPGGGPQFDARIAVDPEDPRVVWASFLEDERARIAVVGSRDRGATWSAPRIVSGEPPGLDKDTLVVRGRTIAVAYDDDHDTFASVSTDGGETWRSGRVMAGDDAFSLSLSSGGAVDAEGRLFFAWGSFDVEHRARGDGPVLLWVSSSADGGATWARTVVAASGAPPACDGCGYAYLSAQMALAAGGDGAVHALWNAAGPGGGPERIFWSRALDGGRAFAAPVDVSDAPAGVEHCFPAIASGPRAGDVTLGWMDRRYGGWSVLARRLAGSGLRATQRVSRGFAAPYGDYFGMAAGEDGAVIAAWGESASYRGPGSVWVARAPER